MTIWIDAQLSPEIAVWIIEKFVVHAIALRDLGLRDATDREIFFAAKNESTIVMTKDRDFLRLLEEHGAPPQVIWVNCDNTSNTRLKQILMSALPKALDFLQSGEELVEISAV